MFFVQIQWRRIPFFKLLAAFAAGIIPAIYMEQALSMVNVILVASLVVFFALLWFRRIKSTEWLAFAEGICLYTLFWSFGYVWVIMHTTSLKANFFQPKNPKYLLVKLDEEPIEKVKTFKAIVKVVQMIDSDNVVQQASGNLLLYFSKDSYSRVLNYGDYLLIPNNLNEIAPKGNPEEFDYKLYLKFHNVYHQGYLRQNWKKVGSESNLHPFKIANNLRKYCTRQIDKYIVDTTKYNAAAMAKAIVLGYTTDLSPDLVFAYANTGAIHVLAVSGMHVGIIFLVLNFVLSKIFKQKLSVLKTVLIVLMLWLFNAVTGFPPSASRATTMFTLVAIAQTFGYKTNIYNTLSVSAFLLLFYNPFMIMQVGFQLSFLAVLGIVYFQPKIYGLLYFSNKIADWFWSITAVSLSAQLATFPIGMLYYHQFPNYFLLSNLFVIPASTVTLVLGMVFLFFSSVSEVLATALAFVLKRLIQVTNFLIFKVENLPNALLQGISIQTWESWLMYLTIAGIAFFLIYGKKNWLFVGLSSLLIFTAYNTYEKIGDNTQHFLIIYNIKGETPMAVVNGRKANLLFSDELYNDESSMLFHVNHHLWSANISRITQSTVEQDTIFNQGNGIFAVGSKRILLLDPDVAINLPAYQSLMPDLVIVTGEPKVYTTKLLEIVQPKEIVFDATNGKSYTRKMQNWLKTSKVPVHCVGEKGAYKTNI